VGFLLPAKPRFRRGLAASHTTSGRFAMTCTSLAISTSSPTDLLDLVERALASLSPRLPASVDRDDLASAGKLALLHAADRFTGPPEEARAYCFVRVRGAMLDELRRLDPLARRRRERARAVGRADTELTGRLGRAPTVAEIATALELSIAEVSAALADLAAEEAGADSVWETLPDHGSLSPLEAAELGDMFTGLRAALERLPTNQALAVRRYYLEDAPLDAIAAELGVSRERARQLREAGEKKLRADFHVLALWEALITGARAA
jgi:RNA polymerase sigma factor FliA